MGVSQSLAHSVNDSHTSGDTMSKYDLTRQFEEAGASAGDAAKRGRYDLARKWLRIAQEKWDRLEPGVRTVCRSAYSQAYEQANKHFGW
jgi:hypothetical protein